MFVVVFPTAIFKYWRFILDRMDNTAVLEELGLSSGEAKVYLALLKLGSSTVAKLKEETGLHRTTIYDFLEKLLNKALVSYVIQAGVKYYKATEPIKLFDVLKEKEEHLGAVLPQLEELKKFVKEEIRVETYRGAEGFKTVYNDILRTKSDVVLFGIEEIKFEERFPHIVKPFFTKEQRLGIKERALARKGTKFTYKAPNVSYRYIPEEYFNPTPSLVFGNKIVFVIWEPLLMIMIEQKDLAESWKKYFEFLWKMADTKP